MPTVCTVSGSSGASTHVHRCTDKSHELYMWDTLRPNSQCRLEYYSPILYTSRIIVARQHDINQYPSTTRLSRAFSSFGCSSKQELHGVWEMNHREHRRRGTMFRDKTRNGLTENALQ